MSKLIRFEFTVLISLSLTMFSTGSVQAASNKTVNVSKYGVGQNASSEQIAGWDIDVRPDGMGLPPGSGSVLDGEAIYEEKCASCHGVFGEGEGRWPMLAGGMGTLTEDRPEKTVGSYWPYLSTLWDYIHRAMPFLQPQSLADDEVYAVTAYILYLNELVDEDFVLNKENFTSVKLPNEMAFVDDPRPDVANTRCMKNCRDKDSIKITWDSTSLGVTPTDHLSETAVLITSEDKPVKDKVPHAGEATYKSSCAMCHDNGIAGAPKPTDTSAWKDRITQGKAVLYGHAINGYEGSSGVMPAKGGNTGLSDTDVKAAVDYMSTPKN